MYSTAYFFLFNRALPGPVVDIFAISEEVFTIVYRFQINYKFGFWSSVGNLFYKARMIMRMSFPVCVLTIRKSLNTLRPVLKTYMATIIVRICSEEIYSKYNGHKLRLSQYFS